VARISSFSALGVIAGVASAGCLVAACASTLESGRIPASEIPVAINASSAAIFQSLLDWRDEHGPAAHLVATGLPPQTIHEGPLWIIPRSGLSDEEIRKRVGAAIATVRSEPERYAEPAGARRLLRSGPGGAQYLGNPVVLKDIALVSAGAPWSAIVTYVLFWRNARWTPVAVILGPPT
jgi:hypothetical protein